MINYESIWFLGIIILLCIFSLVSFRDLARVLKKAYEKTVDALKWFPYVSYLTSGSEKGKHHESIESSEGKDSHTRRRRIFPRSRRSTT